MAGAGFENDLVFAVNSDFSGSATPSIANGLATNGQLWIGRTAVNAGGTHIDVATLTAGTGVSINNGAGSITIAVNGSVVGQTITGDSGGALSPTAGNWNILGTTVSGSGISTSGSGSTLAVRMAPNYNLSDFAFQNTAAATTRTLEVNNQDTNSASSAILRCAVVNASSADAYLQVGHNAAMNYCWGIDNSDSNTLKIVANSNANSATPSGTTVLYTLTSAGAASYIAGNFDITRSFGGGTVSATISNTSNTGSSNALQQITVAGTTAGDPFTTYTVTGGSSWSVGADNSVSGDPYVIAASTALGTSNAISIDTSGNMTVTGTVAPASLSLNSASAVIKSVKRTITNAEIKALNTTPIQLIAAPAAGKAITIISFTARFNYGGNNAFVGVGNLQLRATNGTGQNIAALNVAIYTGTIDKLYATNAAVSVPPFGTMEAQPVVLFIATSDPTGNAANDNTLDVMVTYQEVTF
jgi:hypothetical protein